MARQKSKASYRRGLIDSAINNAQNRIQQERKAAEEAAKAQIPSYAKGMSLDDVNKIIDSYSSQNTIPTLEQNTTPTTPSISDELERMKKAKADTATPRTEGEQKAIDTYYEGLMKASGQKPSTSTPKVDYRAEIDRMNALKADTSVPRTEGENQAIETYLKGLEEAQRYLDSQKPKTTVRKNTNTAKTEKPTTSKNIGTVEIKADGTKNYTKTMSANEQRDYERALQAQAKAVGREAKKNANPKDRVLSPNEQRDLERATNAIERAKEKEKVTTETGSVAMPTTAKTAPENVLERNTLTKAVAEATPSVTPTPTASAQNLFNGYAETMANNGKMQELTQFVDDANETLRKQQENALNPKIDDSKWLVKKDELDALMQNPEFAKDMETLRKATFDNANQDATVMPEYAEAYFAPKENGGMYSKSEYYKLLENKYGLNPAQLNDVADTMQYYQREEERAQAARDFQQLGEEHPVIGTLGSYAGTAGSGIEGMWNTGLATLTGDPRTQSHLFDTTKNELRAGVTNNFDSNFMKNAYQMVAGLGDLGVGAAMGNAPLVLAGNTAGEATTSAIERGSDVNKAGLYGTVSGIADYYLNKVGLDKAKDLAMDKLTKEGTKQFLKRMGVAGGIEGAENVLQDSIQMAFDELINGSNSENQVSYAQKISSGETPEEAFWDVVKERAVQLGVSFGTGALMGAGMQGGTSVLNTIPTLEAFNKVSKGNTDTQAQDLKAQTLSPLEEGSIKRNADVLTDDLSVAERMAKNGNSDKHTFTELIQNDAIKLLNKNGEIDEVLKKNPTIKRHIDGEFKPEEVIESEIDNFRQQVKAYLGDKLSSNAHLECGTTPDVLKESGIKGDHIMMTQKVYDKLAKSPELLEGAHGLGKEGVEKVIRGMNDPALTMSDNGDVLAVIDYSSKSGKPIYVVLTVGNDGTIKKVNDVVDSSKVKSAYINRNLKDKITNNPSEVKYIKGEDEVLSQRPKNAALKSSSLSDSLSNSNVNQIDESVNPNDFPPKPPTGGGGGGDLIPHMEEPVNNPRGKVSQLAPNTIRRGTNLTPEEYAREVDLNDFVYDDITEKESMERAFNMIADEGVDNVKARLLANEAERLAPYEIDALMSITRTNNATARAMELAGEDASALRAETTEIYKKLRQQSTSNAQALQALAKWTRNTPEGMLMQAENIVSGNIEVKGSKLQEMLNKLARLKKQYEFSPEFEAKFIAEAEKLDNITDINSREAKDIMARLGRMVNDEIPVKLPEKVTSFLMDNMLGNVRTLLTRNAGGNVGLAGVEQIAERPLAALIDMGVSKKTGRRTQAGLSKEGLKEYIQGFGKGLADEAHDVKTGLHTARTGENTLENAIKSNRHVFKSKFLDKRDSLIKNGLSVGDRPFYEANYKQTLGDYYRLRDTGKMGEVIQNLSDEDFKVYAETAASLNALGAVYQNDSGLSKGLLGIKEGLGQLSEGALGFDILSQFSMPFVKTPANVVDRAIDYSPFGAIRNFVRTKREGGFKGENFDQNRFVNETARNIIGTGLMAGAGALASSGAINGSYSDNANVKQAQKDSGMQEYGWNIPDWIPFVEPGTQMDIGWLPVVGSNAVAAAAAVDAYKNGEGNLLSNLEAGAGEGINTLFDQSMFQGLQRLFGSGDSYDNDKSLSGNVSNVIKSGLGQFFPSSVRQIAQVTDPYQRDIYGSNKSWEFGSLKNNDINSLINNLPIAREAAMIPKVDLNGNPIRESQGRGIGSKILEDMVLPGKITTTNENPLDQEAIRLSEATGNEYAYRPKVSRSRADIGETPMSNEEWYNFEQDFGRKITATGNRIMESELYQNADDETKEAMLRSGYDAVKNALYSEHNGKKVTGAAKAYVDAGGGGKGIDAVINYIEAQNNPYGLDSEYYNKALEEGEDLSKYNGYKEVLDSNDVVDNKLYRQAYVDNGAEGVQDAIEYKSALDSLGLSDSKTNKAAWARGKEDALQNISNNNERATQAGFVDKDGSPNVDAYIKAYSVLGNDNDVKAYKQVADKGYTKYTDYIPYLESMTNLSDETRGKYAFLLNGQKVDELGKGARAAYDKDGYEGYYYHRLLKLAKENDYNGNGKHDKKDIEKQLKDWGFTGSDYDFYAGLTY